ncbi:protein NUCLEAR FUSION DEFECTIVE 6, mitochondrial [Rosa sericea]
MAWRGGSSLSRSLISAARTSTVRSSPSISSLPRSPPLRNLASPSRRTLFSLPANVGQLACAQSLLPFHSAVASVRMTSHISGEARAFCELSQGTSIDPS